MKALFLSTRVANIGKKSVALITGVAFSFVLSWSFGLNTVSDSYHGNLLAGYAYADDGGGGGDGGDGGGDGSGDGGGFNFDFGGGDNNDTTPPVITIMGSSQVTVFVGSVYVDAGATAFDNVSGTITASIVTTGAVNTAVPGVYTITYTVTDSSGNTTVSTRTVVVVPIPDTTAPTNPIASSPTHSAGVISSATAAVFTWTNSTDTGGSLLAGYSFVIDSASGTVPDNVVDTTATVTAQNLVFGNVFFHVKALDGAGNSSSVSHIGPFVISDSQTVILGSTVNGVFYPIFSPSLASSTVFGISGPSLVVSSVVTGGSIATSTVTNSTTTNATINSSTVATSTIVGGSVTGSNIASSTLINAIVSNSSLSGVSVLGTGSVITDSTLADTTVTNAVIINGVMLSGSIVLPGGTVFTVTTPTPLTSLVNQGPSASFSISVTGLQVSITDTSSDPNEGTVVPDSWNYAWDFGDGLTASASVATTSNDQIHTYAAPGTYNILLSVTDQYGLVGTSTLQVTVSVSVVNFAIVSGISVGTGTGTITPLGTTTVVQGANQTFTITPGATSTISALTVDGVSVATTTSYVFNNVQANHTIDVVFATTVLPTLDIVSGATGPGTITPFGTTTLPQGASQNFSITPNSGADLISLTVDGASVATTTLYAFNNVTANHTIDAVFATSSVPTFNIVSTATGPGTIAPSGTVSVSQGGSQTYTMTPNAGTDLISLAVDGASIATTTSYTFNNVTAGHTIDAVFATSTIPTYDILASISGTGMGTIAPLGTTTVTQGANQTFTITPNATSTFDTLTVDGASVATTTSYTFNNVTASHTIDAGFGIIILPTFDIVSGATGPGTIAPSGTTTVTQGNNQTFTMTPNSGATLTTLLVDGFSIATTASFSFNNVTAGHTIDAIFATTTVPDTTAPTAPSVISVNTISTTTLSSTLQALWTDSTDDSGALAGYSFVWDGNAATTPDVIVETQSTTTTVTLGNGTWYLHLIAVDPSLNFSTPTTTFGPIVINNLPVGDIVPPVGPTFATSTTHIPGVSSATTTIDVSWDTATDNVALAGYSYLWDGNTTGTPDNAPETATTNLSTNLPNGTWYFHILSVDASGNVSAPIVDFGPIIIATTTTDVIPPVGPTLVTSSTHTVGISSGSQNVSLSWDTATDDTALAGYSFVWDTLSSTTPDAIPETAGTSLTTTLSNGTWFFHIQSADMAGNVSSPAIHFGPVIINTNIPADTTPPTAPSVTVVKTGPTTLVASWTDSTDNSGLLAGYSFVWDTSTSTTPDAIVETQATTTTTTVADGLWFVHLIAVDPSLNVSTPVSTFGSVTVDTTAPTITLLGPAVTSVLVNTSYTDAGATALDLIDGNLTSSIVATSSVDITTPGVYFVTYNVSDLSGNAGSPVTRTVNVLAVPDTTPPVITILGPNPTSIAQGLTYTDLGATALDNIDGDITANITTVNTVNTAVLGAYGVTYSVADSFGNLATSTRTVNVIPLVNFSIFGSATGPGMITPSGTSTVLQGSNQTYTITPNSGFVLTALLVDGAPVSPTASYTFTNVQADHTISATFADSQVVIINSDIGGTFYAFYIPTLASSTALNITGISNIINSTTTAPWNLFNTNLNGVTLASSTLSNTTATSSNIINSELTNCSVINSLVKNYHASNCAIANSIVDPHQGFNDLTGSTVIGNSQIYFSDVTYSFINNSYIATSTITNSTLINATSTNSTIASSTINGSTINGSTIILSSISGSSVSNSSVATSTVTNSTISNNSTVAGSSITSSSIDSSTVINSTTTNATIIGSTLFNVIVGGASSTIMNSNLANTTVTDALIVNGIMLSGVVTLPGGATTTISTSTPLINIVNYSPVASFFAVATNMSVSFTDTSTDLNSGGTLGDSWTYNWNFGDGLSSNTAGNPLGQNQSHTYNNQGAYNVTLTLTDAFGATSSFVLPITVSLPAPSGGGGGGGGGGALGGGIPTSFGVTSFSGNTIGLSTGNYYYSVPPADTSSQTSVTSGSAQSQLPTSISSPKTIGSPQNKTPLTLNNKNVTGSGLNSLSVEGSQLAGAGAADIGESGKGFLERLKNFFRKVVIYVKSKL